MELKYRFAYYGVGFFMGIGLVLFFLNGKKASCNFFPNERVLNMLTKKHREYSSEVLELMTQQKVDSTAIANILQEGDVDFSKSKPRQEPCRYYWIDGYINKKEAAVYVQNCDSIVTIQQVHLSKQQ